MKLTIIGSSGSVAGPDNPASCYLIEHTNGNISTKVLLDLGTGALGQLQKIIDPSELDAILITHAHPDHCSDLESLAVWQKYGPPLYADKPTLRIPLYAPQDVFRRLTALESHSGGNFISVFDYHSTRSNIFKIGAFTIEDWRAWHPIPSSMFSITGPSSVREGNSTLFFTGDTDLNDNVIKAARGADVLLAEAGWAHREVNPAGIHMNGTQAGELAKAADVNKMLLTHIVPWVDPKLTLDKAQIVFPNTELASPGATHLI